MRNSCATLWSWPAKATADDGEEDDEGLLETTLFDAKKHGFQAFREKAVFNAKHYTLVLMRVIDIGARVW